MKRLVFNYQLVPTSRRYDCCGLFWTRYLQSWGKWVFAACRVCVCVKQRRRNPLRDADVVGALRRSLLTPTNWISHL